MEQIKKIVLWGLLLLVGCNCAARGLTRHVAVGLSDGKIKVFDIREKKEVATWQGYARPIWLLVDLPEWNAFASCHFGNVIQVWSKEDWSLLSSFGVDGCFDFCPDSKHLVFKVADGKAWVVQLPEQVKFGQKNEPSEKDASEKDNLSSDDNEDAHFEDLTLFFDEMAHVPKTEIHDLKKAKKIREFILYEDKNDAIKDIAFSANGNYFIAWSVAGVVKIWNAKDLTGDDAQIYPVAQYQLPDLDENASYEIKNTKGASIEANKNATCFGVYKRDENDENLCRLYDMRNLKKIREIRLGGKRRIGNAFANLLFGNKSPEKIFLGGCRKKEIYEYDMSSSGKKNTFKSKDFSRYNFVLGFLDNDDQCLVTYGRDTIEMYDRAKESKIVIYDRIKKKNISVFHLRNKKKNAELADRKRILSYALLTNQQDIDWGDEQERLDYVRNEDYPGKQVAQKEVSIYNGPKFRVHKIFLHK